MSRVEQRRLMFEARDQLELSVGDIAELYGVSRQTFYEWQRRFDAEGEAGLENRSTRPRSSPGQITAELEARIVSMRDGHPRWGAARIRSELRRAGIEAPARSTIDRVLRRNGLPARPLKTPPEPTIRFERERANELWQMDGKELALADGTLVEVVACLDDKSRYCASLHAMQGALTAAGAIVGFDLAVNDIGLPEAVLCDRGAEFTGRTKGSVNAFERHLWSLGVCTINGRGYHPQTQGKVERFNRTLDEWFTDEGPFDTLAATNDALDAFRWHYNNERPNQALPHDQTPGEAFAAAELAGPNRELADKLCRRETTRRANTKGTIAYAEWFIGLGAAWANALVLVVDFGDVIEIWGADKTFIRHAKPDATALYLGTGKPRGRPKKQNG